MIRIRSIKDNKASAWIYIQEHERTTNTKPQVEPEENLFSVQSHNKKSQTNQYGRFRYSEKQYGEIESLIGDKIEIIKVPIRIRTMSGSYIYQQQVTIDGACPSIRMRSVLKSKEGPWVYIQSEEV